MKIFSEVEDYKIMMSKNKRIKTVFYKLQTSCLYTTIQWFILILSAASDMLKNIHNIKHCVGDFSGKRNWQRERQNPLLSLLPKPIFCLSTAEKTKMLWFATGILTCLSAGLGKYFYKRNELMKFLFLATHEKCSKQGSQVYPSRTFSQ